MRDSTAWKALQTALWVMLVIVALVLLASCHPHDQEVEKRKPIVIDGGIQCQVAAEGKIFCAIHLEEQVDE